MNDRNDLFGDLLKSFTAGGPPTNFPKLIDVELTNRCNMKCPFCPTGQGLLERSTGDMTQSLLLKILYESLLHRTPMRLIRFGEPTLHEFWDTAIALFEKQNIPVHMNSNGIKLDPDKVLDSGLTSLKISIHSQSGYNAARDMIEARGIAEKPYITVAYLSSEFDFGDLEGADSITRSPTMDLAQSRDEIPPCVEVWNKLSVDWDGIVTACCSDYDRYMKLGDLKHRDDTLQRIWQYSSTLKKYRNILSQGRYKELPLCNKCPR